MVVIAIFAILFFVYWAWFKLKDREEGDLIYIGWGTYVTYDNFQLRVAVGLAVCFLLLLAGLVS